MRLSAIVMAMTTVVGTLAATSETLAQAFSTFRADGLPTEVSRAELVANSETLTAGRPTWLAIHLQMADGWHTYWRNPGDSGAPTTIEWDLPPGFEASPVAWPSPHLFRVGPIANYGYEGDAWLLTQITAPEALAPGTQAEIGAVVRYLVCAEICVPQEATMHMTLPVSSAEPETTEGPLAPALAALPAPSPWPATATADDETIGLRIAATGVTAAEAQGAWFFPAEFGMVEHAGPQSARLDAGVLELELPRDGSSGELPETLDGVLVLDGSNGRRGFRIHTTVQEKE